MIILGINAYHPDASVALVKDGEVIWAAEEERFSRIKHASGFPMQALQHCFAESKMSADIVDVIAISKNPRTNLFRKTVFALSNFVSRDLIVNRLRAFQNASRFEEDYWKAISGISKSAIWCHPCKGGNPGFGSPTKAFGDDKPKSPRFIHVEHHLAHVSSSFFVSGFERAAFLSLDGMGDFSSAMWGTGQGNQLKVMDRIYFPHSAGFLYTATTQFLGFLNFGDEYKVMGLAGFGKPEFLKEFRKLVRLKQQGKFELNLDYFLHQKGQAKIRWEGGKPEQDVIFSPLWECLFGKARTPDSPVTEREKNMAACLQIILEEIYFHVLNHLYEKTREDNLALAGGVAFNGVANGKIKQNTPFKNVYIQPAAGDAGTATGAALYAYYAISEVKKFKSLKVQKFLQPFSPQSTGRIRPLADNLSTFQPLNPDKRWVMDHVFLGSEFSNEEIEEAIHHAGLKAHKLKEEELIMKTAEAISQGKVIGWFQGRMEFGPRALGNRSILADPRHPNIRDLLNAKIKHREMFRPFAPAVLEECASEYFEMDSPSSPFMLKVFPVKTSKRSVIPAVTHVDGTARVQTISQETNPLFWKLIKAFEKQTGIPMLLNTSFNEHEPIVRTPGEAIECFQKTNMDILVLGCYLIQR